MTSRYLVYCRQQADRFATASAWPIADATRVHAGQTDVATAYPGAVHGGLTVLAPPVDSTLLALPLVEGRRLTIRDHDAAIVNRKLLAEEPDLKVGDAIDLRLAGRAHRWRIVGLVDEPGAPPSVYVTPQGFAAATGSSGATGLSLRLIERSWVFEAQAAAELERSLESRGLQVASLQQTNVLRSSFDKHITILVSALFSMAALIALVGGLGLTSTLGINVAERTREFGVMQAIGARPRDIFHVVESEAIAIGVLSWVLALLVSVPLTHALAHIGGHVGLGRSLDIALDARGMALWLVLVVVLALVAGLPPARSAARLTVRETLAYE